MLILRARITDPLALYATRPTIARIEATSCADACASLLPSSITATQLLACNFAIRGKPNIRPTRGHLDTNLLISWANRAPFVTLAICSHL